MSTQSQPASAWTNEDSFKPLIDPRFEEGRMLAKYAYERSHPKRHWDQLNPQFRSHLVEITQSTLEALQELANGKTTTV